MGRWFEPSDSALLALIYGYDSNRISIRDQWATLLFLSFHLSVTFMELKPKGRLLELPMVANDACVSIPPTLISFQCSHALSGNPLPVQLPHSCFVWLLSPATVSTKVTFSGNL